MNNILIKLTIIFFSYLILAHICSIHSIIEGIDSESTGPPDTSYQYQKNTAVSNNEQYSTSQQAGAIAGLQETAKDVNKEIKLLNKALRDINRASEKNTSKLNSLQAGQCNSDSNDTTSTS